MASRHAQSSDEGRERPRLISLPRAGIAPGPLPPDRTRFVGRERERAELRALLERPDGRFVVITGPGGIGKSRLALAVAREWAARQDQRVAFVPLAAVTEPAEAMPAVARALGVSLPAGEHALAALAAAIGSDPLLAVLDNVEQIAAAAPDLIRLVDRCPELRLLLTSRVRLGITGEQNFPLPPLPVPPEAAAPEAIALNPAAILFVERACLARPDFALTPATAPAVTRICRQLEGWPLALELAAARVASLPPAALADRLSPRLPLLTVPAGDAETRFASMREAIAWSVRLLSEAERACFRRLAVFHDGATLEAIEWVLGAGDDAGVGDRRSGVGDGSAAPPPQSLIARCSSLIADPQPPVIDLLAALVDNNLLRIDDLSGDDPRYRMLETIREYALELLAEDPAADALRGRHARWCLEAARQGNYHLKSPLAPRWLARFGAERANMRAARDWLEATGALPEQIAFASYLAEYWDYQGELAEGRAWLERTLALAPPGLLPSRDLARARTWLGWFQHRQGEPAGARADLHLALDLWRACNDREGAAYVHTTLGTIEAIDGDAPAARAHFETALELFSAVGDRPGQIDATLHLSNLAYGRGDVLASLDLAQRGRAMATEWEIRPYLAVAHVAVAQAELAAGQVERSLAAGRTALALAHELGFKVCLADALVSIAAAVAARDDDETAATLLGAAGAQLASTGSVHFFFRDQHERVLPRVRNRYGAVRFARAAERGAALELDALVRLAGGARNGAAEEEPGAPRLTPRERDVLRGLCAGLTDKEIAAELVLSHRTVNACVARILAKLEAPSRTAAAATAIRSGLLDP